ncbi:signal peptidase I [Cellulomonas telluris]|uniref:signal peptidase I n=1 Tax=Cellulomonas telluris TaxID=2306636 RepID=UPI0010A7F25A|nr:signal peptidase I [Cellulomonas telluris]
MAPPTRTSPPFVDRRAPRAAAARRRARPTWRGALRAGLWAVVVAGVLAYLTTLAVPLWYQTQGQRLLLVTSGSMEPRFSAGDVVVLRSVTDPSELRPGLVVTFQPVGSSELVTHRIVSVQPLPAMEPVAGQDGPMRPLLNADGEPLLQTYITTQGDANAAPDPDATPVERVRGVLLRVHEGWGRWLEWGTSAVGRATLLVPALVALAGLELVSLAESRRRRRRAPARPVPPDRGIDALLAD